MTIQGEKGRQRRENRVIATKFGQGLCRVAQDTPQVVAAAGEDIEFDTVDYDPMGWYSVSTFRYTPKSPGTYLVCAAVGFSEAPEAGTALSVKKNNTVAYLIDRQWNNTQQHFFGSCMVELNGVDDYITIFCDPAIEKTTLGVVTSTYLHVVQIGYNKP